MNINSNLIKFAIILAAAIDISVVVSIITLLVKCISK